jgi:hypothetical protein
MIVAIPSVQHARCGCCCRRNICARHDAWSYELIGGLRFFLHDPSRHRHRQHMAWRIAATRVSRYYCQVPAIRLTININELWILLNEWSKDRPDRRAARLVRVQLPTDAGCGVGGTRISTTFNSIPAAKNVEYRP